jgi:hypothetical protein
LGDFEESAIAENRARPLSRPDVETHATVKTRKPPVPYRYDFSLSLAHDWEGQNPAREQGEAGLDEQRNVWARVDVRGDRMRTLH